MARIVEADGNRHGPPITVRLRLPRCALIVCLRVIGIPIATRAAHVHAEAPPPAERPPPFAPLRYDEDYSYLRDPAARVHDPLALEPLKFVPLTPTGEFYFSLGAEIRQKYEHYHNPAFGLAPEDPGGYLLQRYLLHCDLHLGPSFRFFTQLRGAYASFYDGPLAPVNEDGFDIQQAFVDVRAGAWEGGPSSLTLRVGRQELMYGTERLMSLREATNVRQAFDALRLLVDYQSWKVDGFFARPVVNTPGELDEWFDSSAQLWGVYATGGGGGVPGMKLDLYYLGLDRPNGVFNAGAADELRHTMGARIFGEVGGLDYDVESMYQWGDFGSGAIQAWAFGFDTGYTFETAPVAPRIGLRADVTSGDLNEDNPLLGTFNPLFPRGNYFGESATIGPMNVMDVHPMLRLQLPRGVSFRAGWTFLWRYSEQDGVYDNGLNLIQAADGNRSRYVGSDLTLGVDWNIDQQLSLHTGFAHLFAGSFLKETGPGKDLTYVSAIGTYRF